MAENKRNWVFIIIIVAVLALFSFMFAGIVSFFIAADIGAGSANVAIIPIKGAVISEAASGFITDGTSSSEIIELIDKADKNPSVKAILFEINSPGGSAVASDEVVTRVKELNKTKVAWIREVGASGAYWIASATDHIVANRMSVTGSVGVISSYIEFYGFLSDHNITYQRLVSGEYKDMGSPFRELTLRERTILQKKIDVIHDYFLADVTKSRRLSKAAKEEISSAEFYLGSEAKDIGLVDTLGGKKEALEYIEKQLNITAETAVYKKEMTFIEMLKEVFSQNSFLVGKGIGSAMFDENKAVGNLEVWT